MAVGDAGDLIACSGPGVAAAQTDSQSKKLPKEDQQDAMDPRHC